MQRAVRKISKDILLKTCINLRSYLRECDCVVSLVVILKSDFPGHSDSVVVSVSLSASLVSCQRPDGLSTTDLRAWRL